MTSANRSFRLIAGRYRLGAVLGRGAMGTVWSARDEMLGRPVAIKEVLLPPGIPEAEADALRERSLREARAIAALSHPNVVTLYDVARQGGSPFMVMELVASDSLNELLCRAALPPERVVAVGVAVSAALQAAHAAGITHRDVKPGNVLMAHDGRIKLADFGIARNPADPRMTATGVVLGSPAYIAPEIASGRPVSPAADLWGLGATLFAAVEGRPPYDAGDPVLTVSAVVLGEVPRPSCSGPLAEVIEGLMVKDPADRMPLSEVRSLLGAPPSGEPDQRGPPARARPRRTPQATGQLATDPGPLPFAAPADRAPARRTALLWTLVVLIFLSTASIGFTAARLMGGASAFPDLFPGFEPPSGTVTENTTAPPTRVLTVAEADGSQPSRFRVPVPDGWLEFREHGVLRYRGGSVVRFVSPDGAQLIAVDRATEFLVDNRAEDYLNGYQRELAASPELVESGRPTPGSDVLEVTFRSREGPGGELRRTSFLRLVPVGSDLWVVRVTAPTERESAGRQLFEQVVGGFKPGG